MAEVASIGLGHTSHGLHCGLFYEDVSGSVKFLHFAKQAKLFSDDESAEYYEVRCPLPERDKIAVSDFCRLVFRSHASKGLRYAATRTDEFLPDGSLRVDKHGTGFTCSTFVKAILAVIGRPVLQDATWPPASFEDLDWMRKIFKWMGGLLKSAASKKHFAKVDLNCRWSRFKPEEVAAAMTLAPPPAEYKAVEPEAVKLADYVRQNIPPIQPRQAK